MFLFKILTIISSGSLGFLYPVLTMVKHDLCLSGSSLCRFSGRRFLRRLQGSEMDNEVCSTVGKEGRDEFITGYGGIRLAASE